MGSVLGITDFGPVEGTPLIPPSFLTAYFLIYLFLLTLLYVHFSHKRAPLFLSSKIRLLVFIALLLKISLIAGGVIIAGYWLLPTPHIRRSIPLSDSQYFSTTDRIEIVFDKPIARASLEKTITPDTPGRWVFENSLYTTHLYRKLVFYPTYSLQANTTYTIQLSGIKNLTNLSPPYDHTFSFTTQGSPKVLTVAPVNDQNDVMVSDPIIVTLTHPNEHMSEFQFDFEPTFEYETTLDETKRVYRIKPKNPLKQGIHYRLTVKKSDLLINLEDLSIVERQGSTNEYEGVFTTKQAPGITSFEPQGETVLRNQEIGITFSQEMDHKSVEDSISITPSTSLQFTWNGSLLTIKPQILKSDTRYTITLPKGTMAKDGGFLEEDIVHSFKTIGPARVSAISPQDGWSAVSVHTPIKVTFDQEVDHTSVQKKFSISPLTPGDFTWDGNTMVFTPKDSLESSASYTITIGSGIQSIYGTDSEQEFKSTFTTQHKTTKLRVPAYLQKYSLSCEFAALRMALAYYGTEVSEDTLISHVGFDPTAHTGNIWGNPYNAFVGNIKGKQMVDGYGVYWGPIAKAARNYRNAQEFQGWSIGQLTQALSNNNPVVLWVYSKYGTRTSWNTPDGTSIYAIRDEHAVTAVGFVGPHDNPTQIIINDPLSGQVYLSRSVFDKKWNSFNRSGVVVY
jgi:uncharacterized protein YvpB